MATVNVSMGPAGVDSGSGGRAPIFRGQPVTEAITSSGTAASGLLTAGPGFVAQVFCLTPVIANGFGTATAALGLYCPGGVPSYINVQEGRAVSVIDA